MVKLIEFEDAVKSCACIPDNSKIIFICQLYDAINLYKSKSSTEIYLQDYGTSNENLDEYSKRLSEKLKDGIKATKKLSLIIKNVDKGPPYIFKYMILNNLF